MKKRIINFIVAVTITAVGIFNANMNVAYAAEYTYIKTSEEIIKNDIEKPYVDIVEHLTKARQESIKKKAEEQRRIEEAKRKEEEKRKVILSKINRTSGDGVEVMIYYACEKYGVEDYFETILGIGRLETGWFKSDAYKYRNNPGGLSRNEIPLYFESKEAGVDTFVKNLANNYIKKGLTTVEKIGKKYCPINPNWANLVNSVIEYGRKVK